MTVPAQQQHFRRSVVPAGIFRDPVDRLLQKREILAWEPNVYRGPVRFPRRADRLAELRRVVQHEIGGDRGNAVGATERGCEIDALERAEMVPELPHNRDVRAAEPVDRLPVVADREQLGPRRAVEQRLKKPCPGWRDVLEFVNQNVPERAAVTSGLHEIGRPVDHVVEVDLAGAGKRFLVALEDRLEHRKKRLRPLPVPVSGGAFCDLGKGQPAALEMPQEGRHQLSERIDPPLLLESGKHILARDR